MAILVNKAPQLAALAAHVSRRKFDVDACAGNCRARLMTSSHGQDYVYQSKHAEALAYLASPTGSFPFLTAEAAATGQTIADVAAAIISAKASTDIALAEIEGLRMTFKVGAAAAVNSEQIDALAEDAMVALDAIGL